jgi:hypothetical protein
MIEGRNNISGGGAIKALRDKPDETNAILT